MDEAMNKEKIIEDNQVDQSKLEKTVPQLDAERNWSIEDIEKNIQKSNVKVEKNVYDSVPCSNTEKSTAGKRIKESEGIERASIKKARCEGNDERNDELNDDNTENKTQICESIRKHEEPNFPKIIEDNKGDQSKLEKTVPQLNAERNWSSKDREKNIQKSNVKVEKNVNDSVPCSSTKTSTTGKRIKESEGIEAASIKKARYEGNDERNDELNDDNTENETQMYESIRKEEEEKKFLQLFTYVLNEIIKEKNVSETDIDESISYFKSKFKEAKFFEIDFTKWKNICAYLYRFGSPGAGFARFSALKAIRNCEEVKKILEKSDLKIMFVGSGPGNDAIGFCSALAELQYRGSLKLTLVDKFKEWEDCINHVLNAIETPTFGNRIQYFRRDSVKFIKAELPGDLNVDTEYFEALKEADVIIMSKFFTSLNRSNSGEIEKTIILSLHSHMKKGAVIFVNDTLVYIEDRWDSFRLLCKFPDHRNQFCEIHDIEYYKSTAKAEERFNSDDDIKTKFPVFVFIKE